MTYAVSDTTSYRTTSVVDNVDIGEDCSGSMSSFVSSPHNIHHSNSHTGVDRGDRYGRRGSRDPHYRIEQDYGNARSQCCVTACFVFGAVFAVVGIFLFTFKVGDGLGISATVGIISTLIGIVLILGAAMNATAKHLTLNDPLQEFTLTNSTHDRERTDDSDNGNSSTDSSLSPPTYEDAVTKITSITCV